MKRNDLIILKEYCNHSNIKSSFINMLEDNGLITLEHEENEEYLSFSELDNVERFARLYYDLRINVEGLEVIDHLLEQIKKLQKEIKTMENDLQFYKNL